MTKDNKHTPGPWKAHLNVPTAVIPGHIIKQDDSVGRPIASLFEGGGTKGKPEQIANAKLIAAAPDLLQLVQWITRVTNNPEIGIKCDAAIKKATE